MRRGLPEAPWWAWLVMATGVVAVAVMLSVLRDRTASSPAARATESAPATSRSAEPDADTSHADPVQILVVGDGYTAGSDDGGSGEANWTAVVAGALQSSGVPVRMTVSAELGAGYLQPGADGRTFADLATVPAGDVVDVVIFFGSESDVAPPDQVSEAATTAYAHVRDQWPAAQLLVIGPAWRDGDPPAGLLATSAAVRRGAEAAGGVVLDPLAERWFRDDGGDLIGSAGYPTDAGHRAMAGHIAPRLLALLQRAG